MHETYRSILLIFCVFGFDKTNFMAQLKHFHSLLCPGIDCAYLMLFLICLVEFASDLAWNFVVEAFNYTSN